MNTDIIIVAVVLAISIFFFITEKLRVDIVALCIILALLFTNVLTSEKALAGFSNDGTLTIAAMFVLSEGLIRTGVVTYVGRWMLKIFSLPFVFASLIFLIIVASISAFTNNTPIVAIFIPIMLKVAKDKNISASKLLMPLSYASIFGGVITLIGTSTNIVVNSIVVKSGLPSFGLFDITLLGLSFMAVGVTYMTAIGIPLIPNRRTDSDLTNSFGLGDYLTEMIIEDGSEFVGQKLKDSPLIKKLNIDILEITRGEERIFLPPPNTIIQANDLLKVKCNIEKIKEVQQKSGINILPGAKWKDQDFQSNLYSLVEAVIAPHSMLDGHSLKQIGLRSRLGVTALAIRHRGRFMQEDVSNTKLQAGDALLLEVENTQLNALKENSSFVFVSEIEPPTFQKKQIIIALSVFLCVVVLATLEIFSIAAAAFLGGIILILTRSLHIEQAYKAIDWQIIVLLAGTLALGEALQESGGAKLFADFVSGLGTEYDPRIIISILYIVTLILTELMSNTATAALLTPIAITIAHSLQLDPKPFVVTVMYAASLAFMSPVGYQTHLLVYNPGRYKYIDFIKVGTPLNLIFWIMATFLIPIFFPFK